MRQLPRGQADEVTELIEMHPGDERFTQKTETRNISQLGQGDGAGQWGAEVGL